MITDHLKNKIRRNLPYIPNFGQEILIDLLSDFVTVRKPQTLFLLKGYAGTGKTSLIGSLVKALNSLKLPIVLVAPTGRAAKVFASYSNHPTFTIHKKIYRQKSFGDGNSGFSINSNMHKDTLFIVDEASLINNNSFEVSSFGSGHLLDDLIEYVYSQESCNLIILGDSAQLPPVGQSESPALNRSVLQSYNLTIIEHTLNEVARQSQESGILHNATKLRKQIELNQDLETLPLLETENFPDLKIIGGDELPDLISNCYGKDGIEETIIITRSNKRANLFNQGIRGRVLYREEELSNGDLIMITKNNYFWCKDYEEIGFIANGEVAEVVRVRNQEELYNLRFANATLRFVDLNVEIDGKIIFDSLHSETPSMPRDMQENLFKSVLDDYKDITSKSAKMKKLKEDPYFNAFQLKYGYSITCHKSQGGQWKNVILDLGNIRTEHLGSDFYRWLYTSMTRATHNLFLLNPPNQMVSKFV